MKNTTKIIIIIVLVIIGIIQIYAFYRLYKNYARTYEAIRFALINNLVCPDQKDALFCAYENKELPEPEATASDLILSKYTANLVGKLEYKYKAPLPVSLEIYYNDTLFGWVLKGQNAFYVVYRGTRTADEWMQDFSYYQNKGFMGRITENEPVVKQQAFVPVKTSGLMSTGGENIMVHQGFLDVYNSFKEAVKKALDEDKAKPVIITGHSLGAAVATLNGSDLLLAGKQNKTIVFASPKVGNTPFADLLNSQGNLLKWTNTSDIIPTMPYSVSPNFRNPEDPYFFTHGGKTNFFTLNNKSLVNNHGIPTYIQAMDSINT